MGLRPLKLTLGHGASLTLTWIIYRAALKGTHTS
jgi:hypothetical protein